MNILLAVDGSESSDAAVEALARRSLPEGTDVHVISVAEPPHFPETFVGGGGSVELNAEVERSAHERAQTAVTRAVDMLRAGSRGVRLNVTAEVASGSPKRVILERAETTGADLIVVRSHGRGMFDRFVLGSVSQAVALHARCSVEIVRSRKVPATESE